MPSRNQTLASALVALMLSTPAFAQNTPPAERVIRMSGTVTGATGQQATVRFAIYDAESGGTLLWQETQAVALDQAGQYTAFLGAMSADGVPPALFANGAPRWLAVEGPDGALGPRTLLAAVPYAVAAATATNATTLAGRPASDFQLTPAARRKDAANGLDAPAGQLDGPAVNTGTANYIGKFFNNDDLINSSLYDVGGLVGLNTTTPLDIFHSRFTNAGGTQTGIAVQNLSSAAGAYSGMLFYDHTGALRQFQGYNNSTGEYRINNIAPSPSINFMTGSTSRFFINSAGNIGINQASPSYRLDVQHGGATGLRVQSTSTFSVIDIDAANGDAALRFAANGVNQWNIRNRPADNYLEIFELGGGGSRMVIQDGTGNVNIGQASLSNYKLSAGGDVFSDGNFRALGTTLNGMKWVDAGGLLQADIFRFGSVNDRLYVTNNGTGNTTGVYLVSGGTNWTSTSDERLKTDIAPLTGLLDKIRNIRVVNFNMYQTAADPGTGRHKVDTTIRPRVTKDGRSIKQQIGSIAQDWYKDFPEMVVEPETAEDFYGLDYDRIGVVALGAVKELNTVVEQKDAEIKALNDRIAALEAAIKSLTTAVQQQR